MNNACGRQAREGLGGGFNERQDRASVATVEVDADGYDDFGRKKIKARADKKAKEVRCRRLLLNIFAFPTSLDFFHVALAVIHSQQHGCCESSFRPFRLRT